MELLQLHYFQIVAQYENMSRAAEILNIAQPAVSQSIARLEEELGVRLFDRVGRRICLNAKGRYLFQKLPSMLSPFTTLKKELMDLGEDEDGRLTLQVLSGSVLLPELIKEFRKKYPNIQFTLLQNRKNTDYDLCITSLPAHMPVQNAETKDIVLLEEAIHIAIPIKSPLMDKEQIVLGDLQQEGFISLGKDSVFRQITDFYCMAAAFSPNIVFESDTPGTVRGLIEAGLGIAFYPEITWGAPVGEGVVIKPIGDFQGRRSLHLTYAKNHYLSKAAKLFMEFAVEYYKKIKGKSIC